MKIGILKKGDHVLSVTTECIAVERTSGEVDIIPVRNDRGVIRLDMENITTIGFGDNYVENKFDDVTITTF